MKIKLLLSVFLSILFINLDAKALNWTGSEDLSSINAQIICAGTDCVLSNINWANISEQININGVTGLNSFILSYRNANGYNTYLDANDFWGALTFNGFQGNTIEINGGISNSIGGAILLNDSHLSENFNIYGNLSGVDNGLFIESSNIDGSVVTNGDIYSNNQALYINNSNIYKDIIINGGIYSEESQGLSINSSKINGNLISNLSVYSGFNDGLYVFHSIIMGNIIINDWVYALNNNGIYIKDSNINGNLITNADVSVGNNFGININSSNINGDIITNSNVSAINQSGILFDDSNIYGNFITNGDVSSLVYGINVSNSNIDKNIIINGNISVENFYGLYIINQSNISGSLITNGNISVGNDYGLTIGSSNIYGDLVTNGNVSVGNNFGLTINSSNIYGDLVTNGNISIGNDYGLYINESNIDGNLISNGDILVDVGNYGLSITENSRINGDIVTNGDILVGGNYGFYTDYSNIGGNLITNGNISVGNDYGLTINSSNIYGDLVTNGNISIGNDYGLYINESNIDGNLISNGSVFIGNENAFFIEYTNIGGNVFANDALSANNSSFHISNSNIKKDVILNGNIFAEESSGVFIEYTNIHGNIITNSNVSATNQYGIRFLDSSIYGDLISNGDILVDVGNYGLSITENSRINGDIVTNGDILVGGNYGFYTDYSNIGGNLITNGNISVGGNYGNYIEYLNINGDFIINGNIYVGNDCGIHFGDGNKIYGDIIINGNISAGHKNGVTIYNSNINGNLITNGNISALQQNGIIFGSTINGDFINNGKIFAGTIDLDGTINATGDQAMGLHGLINKNFINTGIIASASEGIWMDQIRIFGDIINSGQILGGETDYSGEETAGLYIVNSALMGKIQNTSTGIISGGYGITLSQDYKNGSAGTYASKNLNIINNGTITGSVYDAIAFDITSADSLHGGTGLSYNNILTYSGAGTINCADYDINMGAGDDILNFTNVRSKWFNTDGAETINISNYIVQSTYADDLTAMNTHTDSETSKFNISNMGFLVNTTGNYTDGSNLWLMTNAGIMTNENLANMSIQLEGYAGTNGYFFMDGSELKYHLNSLGIIGAHSDQAVATSDVPSITAANSSIVSAQNLNRSAMNMVSGRIMKLNKDSKLYGETDSSNKTFDTSGLWAQGFNEQSKYNGKNVNGSANSVGYDSDRYGMVMGYDKYLGSGVLLGAAISYGLGDVNGEANQFNTEFKQYQLNLYGSYNIKNYFVDAQVGISKTNYDQKRSYIGNEATAKYDSKSISAGLGAGYVWQAMEKLSVTPYTRFNYIKSNQDAYTESSNLRVDAVELTSEQASFGTEVAYNLLSSMGAKFQPRVFVEYARELGDDEIAINSQYTDNMAIGTTGYSPDLGNSIIRTGAGITMMGTNNDYSVGLDYRYESRERYHSHGLILNGKLFF